MAKSVPTAANEDAEPILADGRAPQPRRSLAQLYFGQGPRRSGPGLVQPKEYSEAQAGSAEAQASEKGANGEVLPDPAVFRWDHASPEEVARIMEHHIGVIDTESTQLAARQRELAELRNRWLSVRSGRMLTGE